MALSLWRQADRKRGGETPDLTASVGPCVVDPKVREDIASGIHELVRHGLNALKHHDFIPFSIAWYLIPVVASGATKEDTANARDAIELLHRSSPTDVINASCRVACRAGALGIHALCDGVIVPLLRDPAGSISRECLALLSGLKDDKERLPREVGFAVAAVAAIEVIESLIRLDPSKLT